MVRSNLTPAAAKPNPCRSCPLLPHTELRGLPPSGVARLDAAHRRRIYAAGESIFRAGARVDGLRVLTRGLVAIRRATAAGEQMIVRLLHPVVAFDLAGLLRGPCHAAAAVAVTEVHVCEVDKATIDALLHDHTAIAHDLLRRLAADVCTAEAGLLALGTLPVRERFLRLILHLATAAGAGHTRFALPLSRQDLAATLGTRPETLARTIREVSDEGLLRFDRRDVEIPDLEALLAAIGE